MFPAPKVIRPRILVSVFLVILFLFGVYFSAGQGAFVQAQSSNNQSSPIKHIVIIMQENHAFDNFFGFFPGIPSPYAETMNMCQYNQHTKQCVKPWDADKISSTFQSQSLAHEFHQAQVDYDKGKMDQFINSQIAFGHPYANNAMGYLTNYSIPDYWDYASDYALDVNFFSSVLSYSYPQHLAALAGNNIQHTCAVSNCQPQFNLNYPTIVTLLNASGVDWKYYSGNWVASNNCKPVSLKDRGLISYWNVLVDFPSIEKSKSTCDRIQPLSTFFSDTKSDYLPQVSWVTPTIDTSDHPGHSTLPNSQMYVSNVINSIMSQPDLWGSTAIFLTWDDWGGYFDHILPTQVDSFGYGFRVPLIVISPYVVPGIYTGINAKQEDFDSLLTTIEANFGLGHVSTRDANEYSLFYMFNFNQSPRSPMFLPSNGLASWPPSSCYSKGLCSSINAPFVPNQPPFSLQSLTPNGTMPLPNEEGDPYD